MPKKINTRAAAARICWQIIDQGRSLDAAMADYIETQQPSPQDKGFVQEVVYGVCRWHGELEQVAKSFLRNPIRKKDRIVHFLLLVGLYQLRYLETANHAAVAETVQACKQVNKVWAKKLLNGCLRNYQRNPVDVSDPITLSHPKWLQEQLSQAWPNHSLAIMHANNQRPPMCIRVNAMKHSRDDYLQQLNEHDIQSEKDPHSRDGIILNKPVGVTKLPDFAHGSCSVQDTAAQQAAEFLQLAPKQAVLDACAAPGGKTAHILERLNNDGLVHALDVSEQRCEQLTSTLQRLQLNAGIYTADASTPPSWPVPEDGYDRILIDAPCSGLGVIRRHPDIKHHRKPSDITQLSNIQTALLENLWQHLKPGGLLLYMTCSVLPVENEQQVKRFVESNNNAIVMNIEHPCALSQKYGVQTLPGVHSMDGFYYSLLKKST